MHAVLIEAFADDWGYHPDPFDEWANEYAGSPDYDPTLWLLASGRNRTGRRLVAQVYGDRGWVSRDRGLEVPIAEEGIADVLLLLSVCEIPRARVRTRDAML